ncbi:protein HOTHEAD-like [Gossypium australe]|uniref:Protein HOTHEAD-like n=1 Tax=Gossypium australe TaxID=47621 RepID=A0A5B6VIF6_9ROSI|nr:protein HOTHEAD-like [Gossypium australe]
MLSGIGLKAELQRLNISMVLHNEFVGKGMVDNSMNLVFVPMTRSVEQSLIQTVGITKMGVYIEASNGFGQSQDSIHCHHGLLSTETGQLLTVPPKQRTQQAIDLQATILISTNINHFCLQSLFVLAELCIIDSSFKESLSSFTSTSLLLVDNLDYSKQSRILCGPQHKKHFTDFFSFSLILLASIERTIEPSLIDALSHHPIRW